MSFLPYTKYPDAHLFCDLKTINKIICNHIKSKDDLKRLVIHHKYFSEWSTSDYEKQIHKHQLKKCLDKIDLHSKLICQLRHSKNIRYKMQKLEHKML